ncbi:hypothetical protein J6590_011988 [Homalodisca vitripennis]|nr:hypothetical protein J6590_011988 [Homalodisca vitripennis]
MSSSTGPGVMVASGVMADSGVMAASGATRNPVAAVLAAYSSYISPPRCRRLDCETVESAFETEKPRVEQRSGPGGHLDDLSESPTVQDLQSALSGHFQSEQI